MAAVVKNSKILKGVVSDIAVTYEELATLINEADDSHHQAMLKKKALFSVVDAVRFNCEATGALDKGVYKSMTQDERVANLRDIMDGQNGMEDLRIAARDLTYNYNRGLEAATGWKQTKSEAAAILAQEKNATTNFTDKFKHTNNLPVDTITLVEARKKELSVFRLAYIREVIKLNQYDAMLEDEWVRAEMLLLLRELEEVKQMLQKLTEEAST
ncbi:uncharacterized protein BKA78DRAFT_376711 [Phyllosticta capitalensis]|uniref:uncharacterized protein n=1 Tax=Phyllosticta capitalensis TaxID=121624 RepID=UPI0031326A57